MSPRFEKVDGFGFHGVRAICEPDGYCADEHCCGRLDLGIRRDSTLNTQNDFHIFAEEWRGHLEWSVGLGDET